MAKKIKKIPQPIPLWQFAGQVSPCRWRAYNRWIAITKETLTRVSIRVAEAQIRKYCGPDGAWANASDIDRAYERRAEHLRFSAKILIGFYLPEKVRNALLTGDYKVTAHKQDGSLVILTAATLAGLDVDLQNSGLYNRSFSYHGVTVTQLRKGTGPQKGEGKYQDMPHLLAIKKLIDDGKARSPNKAAISIVDSGVVLGNSREAKIDRIHRKYKEWEKDGFPLHI